MNVPPIPNQPPPLSDVQRDALIATMTKQCAEYEHTIRTLGDVIVELRAELVAVEQENARLKAGLIPEQPFRA